jgi:hypothetical protein
MVGRDDLPALAGAVTLADAAQLKRAVAGAFAAMSLLLC